MSHHYIKFGLSLITGITGSGKSATLDAIIDYHNDSDPCHIVIIASPVEFVHKSRASIIKHREVGRDVKSFKDGVTQALRHDPDIIVIGESGIRKQSCQLSKLQIRDIKCFQLFIHLQQQNQSIELLRKFTQMNKKEFGID